MGFKIVVEKSESLHIIKVGIAPRYLLHMHMCTGMLGLGAGFLHMYEPILPILSQAHIQ